MNRCFWSDEAIAKTDQLNALKWSNELMYQVLNIQFDLESKKDVRCIELLLQAIDVTKEHSSLLTGYLPATLTNAYHRFQAASGEN